MLQYLKTILNRTTSENGAAAHKTTYSDCLDLFATIGALRSASEQEIESRFLRAYTEAPDLAMKTLFFARDVRGGLGEREVFRICLRWLAEHRPASVRKNLRYVAEYGRWDDLLCLLDTPCEPDALALLRVRLAADQLALEQGGDVSLLAKWLPSINASSPATVYRAKKIVRYLGMDERTYRKTLVRLRARIHILENDLREKNYTFDYSKQPSRAMLKYRSAFFRHDAERYQEFLEQVAAGEKTLHSDTVMPYELVAPYLEWNSFDRENSSFMRPITPEEQAALNATWASLPDFGTEENALAVIDTSGSMYMSGDPLPGAVALSLGLYFAERNTGAFHDHFITFSRQPQLIAIQGRSFAEKLRYIASFCEVADTDLEAVFDLLLQTAVRYRLPQKELPSTLYIISDMEFNCCVCNADATVFQAAEEKFRANGYQLPKIVFWNVQSRNRQQPVTDNAQGVALVSGCTPRLFSMIAHGRMTPLDYMMEILSSERYQKITA